VVGVGAAVAGTAVGAGAAVAGAVVGVAALPQALSRVSRAIAVII
jgi:hypothetical protein